MRFFMPLQLLPRAGMPRCSNTCSSRSMCSSVWRRCSSNAICSSSELAFFASFGSAFVSCFSASYMSFSSSCSSSFNESRVGMRPHEARVVRIEERRKRPGLRRSAPNLQQLTTGGKRTHAFTESCLLCCGDYFVSRPGRAGGRMEQEDLPDLQRTSTDSWRDAAGGHVSIPAGRSRHGPPRRDGVEQRRHEDLRHVHHDSKRSARHAG